MNVRNGFGKLMLRNGTLLSGTFLDNQPTGHVQISYADGSSYKGAVKQGIIDGIGLMESADGFGYSGNFC